MNQIRKKVQLLLINKNLTPNLLEKNARFVDSLSLLDIFISLV